MRFLKGVLKYLGFFILGAITCAIVGLTTIAYLGISYLTTPPETEVSSQQTSRHKIPSSAKATLIPTPQIQAPQAPDLLPRSSHENLRKASRTTSEVNKVMDQIDALVAEIEKKPLPPLCPSLCDHSALNIDRLRDEGIDYLKNYHATEGTRALQDPAFRLKVDELHRLARLMPQDLRQLLAQINALSEAGPVSTSQKLLFAAKAEVVVIKEMISMAGRIETLKKEHEKMKLVRDLRKSCHKGRSTRELISECDSILAQ